MVRTVVGVTAAGASAVALAGALSRVVALKARLVNDRPTFPQPDAGLVLAHEGRASGRARTTYVTRGDLKNEREALGAAILASVALAGSLLIAPPKRRKIRSVTREMDLASIR